MPGDVPTLGSIYATVKQKIELLEGVTPRAFVFAAGAERVVTVHGYGFAV